MDEILTPLVWDEEGTLLWNIGVSPSWPGSFFIDETWRYAFLLGAFKDLGHFFITKTSDWIYANVCSISVWEAPKSQTGLGSRVSNISRDLFLLCPLLLRGIPFLANSSRTVIFILGFSVDFWISWIFKNNLSNRSSLASILPATFLKQLYMSKHGKINLVSQRYFDFSLLFFAVFYNIQNISVEIINVQPCDLCLEIFPIQ